MHVTCFFIHYTVNCFGCCPGDAEKEDMRKQMREELLAQMEFNAQSMMSWDEKVTYKDIKTIASIWCKNIQGYLSADVICSESVAQGTL